LLGYVEWQLLDGATPGLVHLAQSRLPRYWADVVPAIQAHWALVSSAADVPIEADRVANAAMWSGSIRSSSPIR
jgi:hypothetical protein